MANPAGHGAFETAAFGLVGSSHSCERHTVSLPSTEGGGNSVAGNSAAAEISPKPKQNSGGRPCSDADRKQANRSHRHAGSAPNPQTAHGVQAFCLALGLLLRVRHELRYQPTLYHELVQALHLGHSAEITSAAVKARTACILQWYPALLAELCTVHLPVLARAALLIHGSAPLDALAVAGALPGELRSTPCSTIVWPAEPLPQRAPTHWSCWQSLLRYLPQPGSAGGGGGAGGDEYDSDSDSDSSCASHLRGEEDALYPAPSWACSMLTTGREQHMHFCACPPSAEVGSNTGAEAGMHTLHVEAIAPGAPFKRSRVHGQESLPYTHKEEHASVNVCDSGCEVRWSCALDDPRRAGTRIGLYSYSEARRRFADNCLASCEVCACRGAAIFAAQTLLELVSGQYVFVLHTADGWLLATSQMVHVTDGCLDGISPLRGLCTHSPAGPAVLAAGAAARTNSQRAARGRHGGEHVAYFAVPLVDVRVVGASKYVGLLRMAYHVVDKTSELDWGLTSDFDARVTEQRFRAQGAPSRVRVPSAAHSIEPTGLGGNTRGSEGYGEITAGSLQRLSILLAHLRSAVLCRLHNGAVGAPGGGWASAFDLRSHSTLVDVGSGYGKAVLHFALENGLRRAVGIECVVSRHELASQALEDIRAQLLLGARSSVGNPDPFEAVQFHFGDASLGASLEFTHIYAFDRVFSQTTLASLARVLMRSPFYVLVSYRPPTEWWGFGLTIAQPVAKLRMQTTGKESCNVYVYVNMRKVPVE
jgi:hypothetical protein